MVQGMCSSNAITRYEGNTAIARHRSSIDKAPLHAALVMVVPGRWSKQAIALSGLT